MTERKALTKKTRFEVFKRDSFTCQYCGRSAPDVLLQADHIKPVSKNGTNDITNLITSCFDCNSGKSDRELSDDAVMLKRKAQLDKLQERREQIEMMMEWQGGLDDLHDQELNNLVDYINSRMDGFSLNDAGKQNLKSALRRYGLSEMLESASLSADQYILLNIDGNQIQSSIEKFINYIPRIAKSRKLLSEKPYMQDIYRLVNMMRAKKFYTDYRATSYLEQAYLQGTSIEELAGIIRSSGNWSYWVEEMEGVLNG